MKPAQTWLVLYQGFTLRVFKTLLLERYSFTCTLLTIVSAFLHNIFWRDFLHCVILISVLLRYRFRRIGLRYKEAVAHADASFTYFSPPLIHSGEAATAMARVRCEVHKDETTLQDCVISRGLQSYRWRCCKSTTVTMTTERIRPIPSMMFAMQWAKPVEGIRLLYIDSILFGEAWRMSSPFYSLFYFLSLWKKTPPPTPFLHSRLPACVIW